MYSITVSVSLHSLDCIQPHCQHKEAGSVCQYANSDWVNLFKFSRYDGYHLHPLGLASKHAGIS